MFEEELRRNFEPVYRFLDEKNIYEVRSIARAFGINAPTSAKKHDLIMRTIGVAGGISPPEPHTRRGARVKASDAPPDQLAHIQRLIEQCKRIPSGKIVFADSAKSERRVEDVCRGVLELTEEGGRLRCSDRVPGEVFVSPACIERFCLREGDGIYGYMERCGDRQELLQVVELNGGAPVFAARPCFDAFSAEYPAERIPLGSSEAEILRLLDYIAPVGKGQRLLLALPAGGAREVFARLASCAAESVHVCVALIEQRPEDLTDVRAAFGRAEVFSASFDMSSREQLSTARIALERCKRLAEKGEDALLLLDSLTSLAGACAAAGEDDLLVRQLFASARRLRGAGTLTVVGAAQGGPEALYAAANAVWEGPSADGELLAAERCHTVRAERLLSERERAAAEELRRAAEEGGTRAALARFKKIIDDPSIKS